MAAQAVSARSLLTPLAVLVPIGAMPVVTLWALTTSLPLAFLVALGGLAATVVAGKRTYGVRTALTAALTTWVAAVAATPFWYAISINTSICGKDMDSAWVWLPPTAGALVFLLLGSIGLRSGRPFAVPVAFIGGVIAILLLVAAVPGTQGVCET